MLRIPETTVGVIASVVVGVQMLGVLVVLAAPLTIAYTSMVNTPALIATVGLFIVSMALAGAGMVLGGAVTAGIVADKLVRYGRRLWEALSNHRPKQ
jgi:hypothetical protein